MGAPLYQLAKLYLTVQPDPKVASSWALAAFVFGFWFQVQAGHQHFEKRKPALVDGLLEVSRRGPVLGVGAFALRRASAGVC